MKKEKKQSVLRRSGAFKAFLALSYSLSIIAVTAGSIFTVGFAESNMYAEDPALQSGKQLQMMCDEDIWQINDNYNYMNQNGYGNEDISENYRQQLYNDFMDGYRPEESNFEFVITDAQEQVIFQTRTDAPVQYSRTEAFYESSRELILEERMRAEEWEAYIATLDTTHLDIDLNEIWIEEPVMPETPLNTEVTEELPESAVEEIETLTEESVLYYDVTIHRVNHDISHYITGFLRSDLTADDKYSRHVRFIEYAYDYRYVPIIVLAAGFAVFVYTLAYLLYAAGFRRNAEDAVCGGFDRIPFDVFTCLIGCAGLLMIVFLDEAINTTNGILTYTLGTASLVVIGLLVLWWLMSTAVRIRTKTLLSNNLIVIMAKRIRSITRQGAEKVQDLPVLWQIPAAALGFFLLNILGLVLIAESGGFGLFYMVMLYTGVIILLCLVTANLHLLEQGAEKISGGDLEFQIPEKQLFGPFRKHGRNLNRIGDGMNHAVSERMRSERFKTELIANVSHDIRTPLTSIINYTDLLSKLDLEDAQAQEYIDVLTRQSTRLRKLTEDVLEASKATTGSMNVNKETMDLRVLLEQMQGEYAEKLEQNHLQMICTMPDEPLYISADGRLLWRVMDNLFGNLCKYAMENTRVYLDAAEGNGRAVIILRNISAVQLHISADMLMERFVQGDRSRNTEGSGLGLSIAQSLTHLQGGTMELHIDGDLFKVQLTFPIIEP